MSLLSVEKKKESKWEGSTVGYNCDVSSFLVTLCGLCHMSRQLSLCYGVHIAPACNHAH